MDDKNTRIELSTELVPILSLSMYESLLEPVCMFGSSIADLLNTYEQETDFDYATYLKDVAEIGGEIIKNELEYLLEEYGVRRVEFVGIDSPNIYNCSTDSGLFNLIVDQTFNEKLRARIDKWREKEGWEDRTNNVIYNIWGSYDGFWSWMPQNVKEIYELVDYERCVAAFINLLMIDEGVIDYSKWGGLSNERLQEELYHDCADRLSYRDYATIETMFPEELYDAYLKKPDSLDEIIWELHDAKILKYSDFPPKNRTDNAISFLEWCKKKDYTTFKELKKLINTAV